MKLYFLVFNGYFTNGGFVLNWHFAARPSCDLSFRKLMGYNLKNAKRERACRKYQNGQV